MIREYKAVQEVEELTMLTRNVLFMILFTFGVYASEGFQIAHAQNDELYQFLYAVQDETVQVSLNMILSDGDGVLSEKTIYTFEELQKLHQVISSPDGEWIAIATVPNAFENQSRIYLLHLADLQVISIEREVHFPRTTEANITDDFQQFAWSNDSRLFAYISSSSVYLYDLQSQSGEQRKIESTGAQRLMWSPGDSNELIVFEEPCEGSCKGYIKVYDVEGQQATSVELYDVPTGFGVMSLCKLDASPDGSTISFTFLCDYSILEALKEVFMVPFDSQAGLEQLTDFTVSGIQPPDAPAEYRYRFAVYQTEWLEDDTVLIGVTFAQDSTDNVHSQIWLYNLDSETQEILVDGRTLLESALNNEYIALVSGAPRAYFSPDDTEVAVAQFDNNTLNVIETFSGGCRLHWNADGHTLAYTRGDTNNFQQCLTEANELVIVDILDDTIISYQFPDEGQIYTVGWISNVVINK